MKGADVTYCFVVTNTGNTPLGSVTVVNGDLSYSTSSIGILAPGKSAVLYLTAEIAADLINNATVTGTPLYADESPIPDMFNVMANDTSSVTPIEATPSIAISNTVYLGSDDGAQCASALEYVEAADGTSVVYCFNVTNTGNTYLSNVTVDDAALAITRKEVGGLAPGESKMVFVTSSIPSIALTNVAIATGNPTFASGKDMASVNDVVATDDSSVGALTPSIAISNTVYLGSDNGAQCASALEYVEEADGTSVVYCFNVTNTGNTYLSDVMVDDAALAITRKEVGDLVPGESKMVFETSSIPSTALNNVATATGNPTSASGQDLAGVDDVVATDDSSVGPLIVMMDPVPDDDDVGDGNTRSGDRDPYRPPNDPVTGNCLHDSYQ
jgi:large repetitive protein